MVEGSVSVRNIAPPEIRTRLEYQGFSDGVYQFPSLKIEAIPWCTFHDRPLGTGAGGGDFNPLDEACFVPPTAKDILGLYDCVISTGGPDHKWWVDL